jgi:cyclic pyranopterin phosphate synthase
MCKAVDKTMHIDQIRLIAKRGGRSGDWQREEG